MRGLIDEKNAYGDPIEVVLERLKFLPWFIDALNKDPNNTAVYFSQSTRFMLVFPWHVGLNHAVVVSLICLVGVRSNKGRTRSRHQVDMSKRRGGECEVENSQRRWGAMIDLKGLSS